MQENCSSGILRLSWIFPSISNLPLAGTSTCVDRWPCEQRREHFFSVILDQRIQPAQQGCQPA